MCEGVGALCARVRSGLRMCLIITQNSSRQVLISLYGKLKLQNYQTNGPGKKVQKPIEQTDKTLATVVATVPSCTSRDQYFSVAGMVGAHLIPLHGPGLKQSPDPRL